MIPGLTEASIFWLLCGSATVIVVVVAMISKRRKQRVDFPKIAAVTAGYLHGQAGMLVAQAMGTTASVLASDILDGLIEALAELGE